MGEALGVIILHCRGSSAVRESRGELVGTAVCLAPRFRHVPALGVVGQDSEDGGSSSRPDFLGGHKQPASRLHHQGPRVIPSTVLFILKLARNMPSKHGEWSPLPASAVLAARLPRAPLGRGGGLNGVSQEHERRCCQALPLRSDPVYSQQGPQAGHDRPPRKPSGPDFPGTCPSHSLPGLFQFRLPALSSPPIYA